MRPISLLNLPMHRTAPIGQTISLLIFISYFTVYPAILKRLWPYFQDTFHSQYSRHLAVILFTNVGCLSIYNLVMYFIYTYKIPFFEQYRCNPDKLWPWQSEPQKWRKTLKKTVFLVLLNMFVLNALFPLLQISLGGISYKYSLGEFPDTSTILFQFIFSMFVEDVTFYWSHKMFHHPSFYWIHKVHHEHYNTVCISATSSHPIQYFFGNAITTGLGLNILSKIMPVHFATMFIFFTFRLIETCEGHCGYEWSWSTTSFLPFKLDSDYHNFHHAYNIGNYGSMFGFWDNMMGTNKAYAKYTKKLEKNSKKN